MVVVVISEQFNALSMYFSLDFSVMPVETGPAGERAQRAMQ